MTAIPLGPGGEFDRIRAIASTLEGAAGPLGDDTAPIPDGVGQLVVSTDASVEGVHFRREWLRLPDTGWRATASALSDLAAAGATPAGLVVAVGVPATAGPGDLIELMRGVGNCAVQVGTQVLGGDLTASPVWSVTVTVFGHAPRPMSRAGARPGDGLWVTGALGGARSALTAWERGGQPGPAARIAFAHPVPRLAAGRWLAEQGATAMMDLSDGLAGDAPHLAAASGVGMGIVLGELPLHPAVADAARDAGEEPAAFAAAGGEDYELLVTLPGDWDAAALAETAAGVPLTRIGTVVAGSGVRFALHGTEIALQGYRHRV